MPPAGEPAPTPETPGAGTPPPMPGTGTPTETPQGGQTGGMGGM
jgi:hypothetical protein